MLLGNPAAPHLTNEISLEDGHLPPPLPACSPWWVVVSAPVALTSGLENISFFEFIFGKRQTLSSLNLIKKNTI